jgi:hypothetical protein
MCAFSLRRTYYPSLLTLLDALSARADVGLRDPVLGTALSWLLVTRCFMLFAMNCSSNASASGIGLVNTTTLTILTSDDGRSFLSLPTCRNGIL